MVRAGVWAGVVGPLLFVAVFTVEGALRPGYRAAHMYVSELALGPRGGILIANFVVLGLCMLLFARAVARVLGGGAGPVLLAIIGASLLASGPFVMDPPGTPREAASWHGILHGIFGGLVFSLTPVSMWLFLRRFWSDTRFRAVRGWTLAGAIAVTSAVVLFSIAAKAPPEAVAGLRARVGLLQRAVLVPYLAWVAGFALSVRSR
jgi:hypothetical membrane protein